MQSCVKGRRLTFRFYSSLMATMIKIGKSWNFRQMSYIWPFCEHTLIVALIYELFTIAGHCLTVEMQRISSDYNIAELHKSLLMNLHLDYIQLNIYKVVMRFQYDTIHCENRTVIDRWWQQNFIHSKFVRMYTYSSCQYT